MSSRRLALVHRPAADAGAEALRALAIALAPLVAQELATERAGQQFVEVARAVPLPRRAVLRACRSGAIGGAVKVGRRWCAPRASIDAWLRSCGPRGVAPPREADEFEPLRASLSRPTPSRAKRRAG